MFFLRLLLLVMAEAAIVGLFVEIPILSSYAFWIMVAAYLLWIVISKWGTQRIKWQFMLTILLTGAAIVGVFVPIPIVGDYVFWVMTARKLAGAADGNRQMVDILNAVLSHGLPAVEAACAEALSHEVHSADVVLNILARQRDPAPLSSILTPDALKLRHAPIADCAHYDNLRRTI